MRRIRPPSATRRPDGRSYPQANAELVRRGLRRSGHRARQLTRGDYARYDCFIGMDQDNVRRMRAIFGAIPMERSRCCWPTPGARARWRTPGTPDGSGSYTTRSPRAAGRCWSGCFRTGRAGAAGERGPKGDEEERDGRRRGLQPVHDVHALRRQALSEIRKAITCAPAAGTSWSCGTPFL